jgi:Leu/Phe-tRNA-protein transferase
MVSTKLDHFASLFSEGVELPPPSLAERRKRREVVLHEGAAQWSRRIAAALAALGRPGGAAGLFCAADLLMRDGWVRACGLPDPRTALDKPEGLCGLARHPAPAEALEAYAGGLVLHAPIGPVCWWSPARRWVAAPGSARSAGSAAEALVDLKRLGVFVEMDGDFDPILLACSRTNVGAGRPGFGEALMRIYSDLAECGLVHSIALRAADGSLAAGAFGLAIGGVFATEAYFGPSELARTVMILLDRELAMRNFALHEARLGAAPGVAPAAAFDSFGFTPISRAQFVAAANERLSGFKAQPWRLLAGPGGDRRENKHARLRPAYGSAT